MFIIYAVIYLQPRATVSGIVEVTNVDSPYSDAHNRDDLQHDDDSLHNSNKEAFLAFDKSEV